MWVVNERTDKKAGAGLPLDPRLAPPALRCCGAARVSKPSMVLVRVVLWWGGRWCAGAGNQSAKRWGRGGMQQTGGRASSVVRAVVGGGEQASESDDEGDEGSARVHLV